jgi:predicted DCC family thiol-disulfide oxidoreductase YuxK
VPDRIILFDGVCSFCNFWVRFIIRHDKAAKFRFAPFQSHIALQILGDQSADIRQLQSVVLIEQGIVYTESTAALRICRQLDGMWKLGYVFIFIPRALRDMVYRFVAAHRYRWFGKKSHCMMPDPKDRHRFLDDTLYPFINKA